MLKCSSDVKIFLGSEDTLKRFLWNITQVSANMLQDPNVMINLQILFGILVLT